MNDLERMRSKLKDLADEKKLVRALTVAAVAIEGLVSKEISEEGDYESEALMGLMLAAIAYGDHLGIDRPTIAEVFGNTARTAKLKLTVEGLGAS